MVIKRSTASLGNSPAELIQFVNDEMTRDAEELVALFAEVGLAPPPGETRGFNPGILLDLGAYVRLRRWEAAGHTVHTEAGLPSANTALGFICDLLCAANVDPAELSRAGRLYSVVHDLTVSRFAWAARQELGADVVLNIIDEDTVVEALAQFLWKHR